MRRCVVLLPPLFSREAQRREGERGVCLLYDFALLVCLTSSCFSEPRKSAWSEAGWRETEDPERETKGGECWR